MTSPADEPLLGLGGAEAAREINFRRSVAAVSAQVRASAAGIFSRSDFLDATDQAAAISRSASAIGTVVTAGQHSVADLTNAHLAPIFGVPPQPVAPDVLARPGVSKPTEYARPFWTAVQAQRDGASPDAAMQAGLHRLDSNADTDLQMAKVRQSRRIVTASGVKHFRRIARANACPLCKITSTQQYRKEHLMPIHPGCHCTVGRVSTAKDDNYLLHPKDLTDVDEQRKLIHKLNQQGLPEDEYNKQLQMLVATREHGEIGPVITWRHHKFTGADDLPEPVVVKPQPVDLPSPPSPSDELADQARRALADAHARAIEQLDLARRRAEAMAKAMADAKRVQALLSDAEAAARVDLAAAEVRAKAILAPPDPLPMLPKITETLTLEEDLALVNPRFHESQQWQINCTRCSTVVELRARGYDVAATPKPESIKDNGYESILHRWLSPDGKTRAGDVGPYGSRATINRVQTYWQYPAARERVNTTGLGSAASDATEDTPLGMSSVKDSRVWDFLPANGSVTGTAAKTVADAAVKAWGPGSRGYVTVEWDGGGAHIFNVKNVDGEVIYFDGQTNKLDVSSYWGQIKADSRTCRIVRTDDLTPTEDTAAWVFARDKKFLATEKAREANKARRLAKEQAKLEEAQKRHALVRQEQERLNTLREWAEKPRPSLAEIRAAAEGFGSYTRDFRHGVFSYYTNQGKLPDWEAYSDNKKAQDAHLEGFYFAQNFDLKKKSTALDDFFSSFDAGG